MTDEQHDQEAPEERVEDLEVTDQEAAEQVHGGALIPGTDQEAVAEEVLGKVHIPAATVPKFSAGSQLKAKVQAG